MTFYSKSKCHIVPKLFKLQFGNYISTDGTIFILSMINLKKFIHFNKHTLYFKLKTLTNLKYNHATMQLLIAFKSTKKIIFNN